MSLAGGLIKYTGGELAKSAGKGLVKAGAQSALNSLVPKIATKAGTKVANKIGNEFIAGSILNNLAPTTRMLDKAGRPVTFYHSTPNEFDKFDDAMLGSNTGYENTALGHFVTPDKDFSKRFIDIDNVGKTGRTMELQANVQKPITHPYMAGYKYDNKDLDKIVEDYLIATNNQDGLGSLRELAEEDGANLYDTYMDLTFGGDSPFEYSADDRKALLNNGFDAVEIVEGPKSGLVEGAKSNEPVSSYAILNGENLRPVRHLPINQMSNTEEVPVSTLRTLFRGQKKGSDDLYYNKGDGTTGSLTVGNGYYMTPNAEMANIWAGEGITPIRVQANTKDILSRNELVEKTNWANDLINDNEYMAKLWGENPEMADFIENLSAGRLPEVSKYLGKPFIQPDSGQGEELSETIFFPDTRPKLTEKIRASLKGSSPKIQESKVELSPQQQEFFKDSVIRDAEGNLMPMYHGTNNDFTVFDINKSGKSNTIAPVGFWFTPNEQGAKAFASSTWYGDNPEAKAMKVYLNIKNPKVYESVNNTSKINELTKEMELAKKQADEALDKMVSEGRYSELYKNKRNEYSILAKKASDIENQIEDLAYEDAYEQFRSEVYAMEGKSPREANIAGMGSGLSNSLETIPKFVEKLKSEGYDGIIIKGTRYDADTLGGKNDQYIAFDPEQIKNVDNLKPTDNPDIRYATGLGKGSSGFDNSIERIGSEGLPATRKDTLPEGWDILEKYLGGVDKRVENMIGKAKSKITKSDLAQFLEENGYDSEGTFNELWQRAKDAVDDMTIEELNFAGGGSAADVIQMRQRPDMNNIEDVYMGNKGRTGRLDTEYSDRLGISKSTTPMSDKLSQPLEYAQGDYGAGVIGLDTTWSSGEAGVSNVAHERMHAWQDKSRGFDYSDEFKKAFEELEDEIIPLLHNKDEISKYWNGRNTDYYFDRNEQEARMVQDYLEYKNHTKRYMGGNRKYEYDERIIKPFDKFYAKLRELSKKGIAIPALAGVFGLGALANKKDDEKA